MLNTRLDYVWNSAQCPMLTMIARLIFTGEGVRKFGFRKGIDLVS